MPTITLTQAWTYRTPMVTMGFGAGTHEVPDIVQTAAIEAGVIEPEKDEADGSSDPAPRAPRTPRKTEG